MVVDYAYDTANRLTERKESGSTTDIETYVYDGLGRLVTAEKGTSSNGDAVSASAFTYDSLSRVNEECQSIAEGSGQSVNYAYDKAGNRTEVIYHGAATTANYAYDVRDRATSIDNGSQRLADYTWIGSAINQRDTTCDYPGTTKPKFKTAFERDGILRVTKVDNQHLTSDQATSGYNDLGEFAYTYDAASNPLTVLQANGMGKLDADRWYAYDTLNRLITSEYDDNQMWATPIGNDTSSYVYDDLGNRSSHSYRDAASIAYEHDKANRMTKLATLTQGYDLAGNLLTAYSADRGTSYVYKYDHHNRLIEVKDSTDTTRKAAFTYDALGRRIEHVNDVLSSTTRYFYDGVNEIVETDGSGNDLRYYIHGISYVDERLMMVNIDEYLNESEEYEDRPYYFTIDRMYNVRFLVDRAGALVERYMYDAYGRPHIRESCGRGDMDNETTLTSTDSTRFTDAKNGTIWDPRADIDDDGDVDANDQTAYDDKVAVWPPPTFGAPTVKQAFSDVNNPFMFQGRPYFALDTVASATVGKLMVNDHRARMNDPATGRWLTRDPLWYNRPLIGLGNLPVSVYLDRSNIDLKYIVQSLNDAGIYQYLWSNPLDWSDESGLGGLFGPWWPDCCWIFGLMCYWEGVNWRGLPPASAQVECMDLVSGCQMAIQTLNPCHSFDQWCLTCLMAAHIFHISE